VSKILIPNGVQANARGIVAINDHCNGTIPCAIPTSHTAQLANVLLGCRGRLLGTYFQDPVFTTGTGVDSYTGLFLFHSGPSARTIRMVGLALPAGAGRATNQDSFVYFETRPGLTGTGTYTSSNKSYACGTYVTTNASQYYRFELTADILPDTDYRLYLHQQNIYSIRSLSIFEEVRTSFDTATDFCIDSSTMNHMAPITTTHMKQIVDAAEKIWRMPGNIYDWHSSGVGHINVSATTLTNPFDSSTTASATTEGWPVPILTYAGSLDSSNVGVVCWVALDSSGAPGADWTFEWRDQANNKIATVTMLNADFGSGVTRLFFPASAFLTDASGGTPTTKIDFLAKTSSGANPAQIRGHGIYRYVLPDPRSEFTSATLAAWYDASRETYADTASVTTWTDRSGNALDATAGTAPAQPVFASNKFGYGKHAVRFRGAGTGDYMTVADSSLYKGSAITLFIVEQSTTGTAGLFLGYPHDNAGTSPFYRWKFARTATDALNLRIDSDDYTTAVSAARVNGVTVWCYTTSNRKTFANDAAFEDGTDRSISYPNATGIHIGGNHYTGAEFVQSYVGEIQIWNGTMSDAEIAKNFAALCLKWQKLRD